MTFKEIKDLLKLVADSDLSEVKVKQGDTEVVVRNKNYAKASTMASPVMPAQMVAPMPAANVAAPAATTAAAPTAASAPAQDSAAESTAGLMEIRSPIVGTFYRSPSPDKPVYVSVGDTVGEGSVVCIVEAMKLFNEIESEVSGKIVKVVVDDASPVEYDQVLFLVDPKG